MLKSNKEEKEATRGCVPSPRSQSTCASGCRATQTDNAATQLKTLQVASGTNLQRYNSTRYDLTTLQVAFGTNLQHYNPTRYNLTTLQVAGYRPSVLKVLVPVDEIPLRVLPLHRTGCEAHIRQSFVRHI